jgi:hypothetical protein
MTNKCAARVGVAESFDTLHQLEVFDDFVDSLGVADHSMAAGDDAF